MTFRTTYQRPAEVHPHVFAAAAELVHALDRFGRHDIDHLTKTIATHGPVDVVAVLVQQLRTAIPSPRIDVQQWAADEVERSEEALVMDAELHIMQQNEEMKSLGIPEKYRDRLRAWANGASVDEIHEHLNITDPPI